MPRKRVEDNINCVSRLALSGWPNARRGMADIVADVAGECWRLHYYLSDLPDSDRQYFLTAISEMSAMLLRRPPNAAYQVLPFAPPQRRQTQTCACESGKCVYYDHKGYLVTAMQAAEDMRNGR